MYEMEEINSAGQAFYIRYHNPAGNLWRIEIYTDEEHNDLIEAYGIQINSDILRREGNRDEETLQAFIEQAIADSVRYSIERL